MNSANVGIASASTEELQTVWIVLKDSLKAGIAEKKDL
jgi:hypothetical protein